MGGNKQQPKARTDFERYVEELTNSTSGRRMFTITGLYLDIGLALYHMRCEAGMSVVTCAERLRCTPAEITRMEEGSFEFTLPMLVRIGDVFGKKIRVVFS
ncbi:MAG TPA: hypothetical protein DDW36_00140 [Candidatus Magasanikbacteria bacterium]|nr:hypothetical protein [Candidatus Magasanikbacteria bacterium]